MTGSVSPLVLDEYYDKQDERFVDTLRQIHASGKLAGLADRWKRDTRPWARERLFDYLTHPLDRPGHHPLVKRLFKHAEAEGDDALMGAFMVALDRVVRRQRKIKSTFDPDTRTVWQDEVLVTPRNSIPPQKPGLARGRAKAQKGGHTLNPLGAGRLFSYHTRYYLRRRAWRYFRRLAYQHPERYLTAAASALGRYRNEDVASGENILDNWSLMHACYRHHEALAFTSSLVRLREGGNIGELAPAPAFPELWKSDQAAGILLRLVLDAESRLVRLWAMGLLRSHHKAYLDAVSLEELLRLFDHSDGDVQQFGAEILQSSRVSETADIGFWLRLLHMHDPTAVALIAEIMRRKVTPDRFTLDQLVDLAAAAPTPVARMGLDFLKMRSTAGAADARTLSQLADARCEALAAECADFALSVVGNVHSYERDAVTRFFDSLSEGTRSAAWRWLTPDSPGYHDPLLWCRLLETPHDDLRMALIDLLERRVAFPGSGTDDMETIWCTVLLGIHRGGRRKPKAIRQMVRTIRADPLRADRLLPLLAAAVRSVREPERRAGLAALGTIIEELPELHHKVVEIIPELGID